MRSYLDEIADAIRDEVPPDKVPEGGTILLFRLYAVLALAKGATVTLEDVHNAWSAWMLEHDPAHESIQPFSELGDDVKQEDEPYAKAIRTVATRFRAD